MRFRRLGDWCAVDLLTDDDTLSRVIVEHVDPAKVELARELQRKYPPAPGDRGLAGDAIRERRAIFYPDIPEDFLQRVSQDDEHLRVLRELGLHSAIITPMIAADRVLGALTVVSGRAGYPNGVEPEPRKRKGIKIKSWDGTPGVREFARLARAVGESKLQIPIADAFKLENAPDAHRLVEKGHVLGKVVLRVK